MESFCRVCQSIDFDTLLYGPPTCWAVKESYSRSDHTDLSGSDHVSFLLGPLEVVRQRASNGCAMCNLVLARRTYLQSQDYSCELIHSYGAERDDELVWLCTYQIDCSDSEVATTHTNAIVIHFVAPDDENSTRLSYHHSIKDVCQIYAVHDALSPMKVVRDEVDFDVFRNRVRECQKHHICEAGALNIKTRAITTLAQHASIRVFGNRHRPDLRPRNFKLIDVNSQRIVEDNSSKRYPEYAALSYTWGTPDANFHLTKSKIFWRVDARNVKSTPIPDTLPTTLMDAITVTKRMGLRYLWIDCLCIVQDDEHEKHTLIQKMDSVYRNATFCIVALAGKGPNAGLPGVRAGTRKKQQIVKVRNNLSLCLKPLSLNQLFIASTWGNRAWTFQEFTLSKRCLIFSEEEVIFQCADIRYRETWSREEHRLPDWFWEDDGVKSRTMIDLFQESGPHPKAAYRRLVEEYTTRQMSFSSDGINAFAGTSRVMGECLRSEMVYGTPKNYMLEFLAWNNNGNSPRRRAQSITNEKGEVAMKLFFPSWSWVAWDGAVSFHELDDAYDVESDLSLVETPSPLRLPVRDYASYFASEDSKSTGASTGRILSGILPLWAKCAYFNMELDVPQDASSNCSVSGYQDVVFHKDGLAIVGSIEMNSVAQGEVLPKGAWCLELFTKENWCYIIMLTAFDYEISEPKFETLHLISASQDPLVSIPGQNSLREALKKEFASSLGTKRKRYAKMTTDPPLLAYRISSGQFESEAWKAVKPQFRLVLLG